MAEAESDRRTSRTRARAVGVPRLLLSEPVGAGDVVKRVTTALGVQPCGRCQRRAEQLNSWLEFKPRT